MARDPLLVLQAVRQRAVEQARQELAECMKAETEAVGKLHALNDAAKLDRSAGQTMSEAPEFLQMFARRLAAVRGQRSAIEAELAAAQALVADARAIVVTARTQAEALEQLIAEQTTRRLAEVDRKAQHSLDDIARAATAIRRVAEQ